MQKKALIVSPYLDHLGGGERYMLSFASVLEGLGYSLYFGWDDLSSVQKILNLLNLNIASPNIAVEIKHLYHHRNPLRMWQATRSYDLVVYLSDGSIPLLGGKRNILHMQVPFHNVGGKNWKNMLKKSTIDYVVVNSLFTKQIVDKEYDIKSKVLYPPVESITCPPQKENIILSVGRFESSLNIKKQDVLIEAFKKLSIDLSDWKLVLVGGTTEESYPAKLKDLAKDYNVEIITNATHQELCDLYSRAKIYWHAAGYLVDELKNPELVEHFGISTVEAISASAIPIVVGKGGQKEIVQDPQFLWETTDELVEKTKKLANLDFKEVSHYFDISLYSSSQFAKNVSKLVI